MTDTTGEAHKKLDDVKAEVTHAKWQIGHNTILGRFTILSFAGAILGVAYAGYAGKIPGLAKPDTTWEAAQKSAKELVDTSKKKISNAKTAIIDYPEEKCMKITGYKKPEEPPIVSVDGWPVQPPLQLPVKTCVQTELAKGDVLGDTLSHKIDEWESKVGQWWKKKMWGSSAPRHLAPAP